MSAAPITLAALRESHPGIGNRVLALPEYGCVYVKNNKAGCSTVTLWLHRAHTGDHSFSPRNIHAEHGLPRPRDIGWPRVLAMLSGGAYRFTFVREPLGRVESAYHDKFVRQKIFRVQLQQALGLVEDVAAVPTFAQYVAWLETQDPQTMDPHFRPQHLNLMHGLVEYDLIGRLESFETDLARVRDATGIPDVPLEVRNASARPDRGSMFDGRPDLRARVEMIYARDMELLGY